MKTSSKQIQNKFKTNSKQIQNKFKTNWVFNAQQYFAVIWYHWTQGYRLPFVQPLRTKLKTKNSKQIILNKLKKKSKQIQNKFKTNSKQIQDKFKTNSKQIQNKFETIFFQD